MARWLIATVGVFVASLLLAAPLRQEGAKKMQLKTPWADKVDRKLPHNFYPRPQMVRANWTNLNGEWDLAITAQNSETIKSAGKILVPFPIESALSGFKGEIGPGDRAIYRTELDVQSKAGTRQLLHFGAVDHSAEIRVNDKVVGTHKGGFAPFTIDITDALYTTGKQQLEVRVTDPSDTAFIPRGKQVQKPEGIWYTPVTGIWQTVWLETVPTDHVANVRFETKLNGQVTATIEGSKTPATVEILLTGGRRVRFKTAPDGDQNRTVGRASVPSPVKWSPALPWLYNVKVMLDSGDAVESYLAFREIKIAKDKKGVPRIMLNGEPIFNFGPLDQGWWPDGLYTAPTEEALLFDIDATKKYGFNTIRKHVKVEPARWYYECDKLGMLVWQDMPSAFITGKDAEPTPEEKQAWEAEWKEIIDSTRHFPSIVMWVPFNEGWGQFDTERVTDWTKKYDPSRLVNNASGWTDKGAGDVLDIHVYPGPAKPPNQPERAAVLGEFGGLGLPLAGHTWLDQGNWGYRSYQSKEELKTAFDNLLVSLEPLIGEGLCAAIYTQTTDVEIEVNGLLTYDRKEEKLPYSISAEVKRLIESPSEFGEVLPAASTRPALWRYTVTSPAPGWADSGFDDKGWTESTGGFGSKGTPGAVIGTEWKSEEIWLRREFALAELPKGRVFLKVHHDEDAEVYLNGQLIASLKGHTTNYVLVPLQKSETKHFKKGTNLLAIHCKQTKGGQYIDAGFMVAK